MKRVLPLLLAVAASLSACKTTTDRFDLYAPDKPQGPATSRLRGMTLAYRYNHQSATETVPVNPSAAVPPPTPLVAPLPTENPGIAPAPALGVPPPLPGTAPGAPASTIAPPVTAPEATIPGTSTPAVITPQSAPPAAGAPPTPAAPPGGIPGLQ